MALYKGSEPVAGLSNCVSKSGDTMTGPLVIDTNSGSPLIIQGYLSASENSLQDISARNKEGNRVGLIRFSNSSNKNQIQLNVIQHGTDTNKGGFTISADANGKLTYSPVQLITTYVSGTSGYNIWSNGYCEQWGIASISSVQYGATSVTLTKTFSNTNYTILLGGENSTNNGNYTFSTGSTKNTNSFTIWAERTTGQNHTNRCHWKVSGYLASNQY